MGRVSVPHIRHNMSMDGRIWKMTGIYIRVIFLFMKKSIKVESFDDYRSNICTQSYTLLALPSAKKKHQKTSNNL